MSTAHRKAFGTVFAQVGVLDILAIVKRVSFIVQEKDRLLYNTFSQIGAFLVCFFPFVIFVGLTSIDEDMVPKRLQVRIKSCSRISKVILILFPWYW